MCSTVHALMAHAQAGRDDQVRRIMAVLEQRSGSPDTNGHDTRDVGLPIVRALVLAGALEAANVAA